MQTLKKESFFRYSTLPNPNFTTDRQSGINDLIKFDKDMKQVYAINLDSKIKEGAIYFILAVKDNIWIVYHDWEKKDKLLNLFARKLNKETGELDENIRAIGSITPAKEPEAYTPSAFLRIIQLYLSLPEFSTLTKRKQRFR